mmetsp:Transcript_25614/g.63133  ORF Transcript_25614/g.63133 Transcript_25614/m.63133 type:complete len:204 (+) Transcript_25614:282-893(+)
MMASSFSGVIPGRPSTRERCTAASPVLTTNTASTVASYPFSYSSGMSNTTSGCRCASACARNSHRAASTSGCTMSSSFFMAASSPSTCLLSAGREMPPSGVSTPAKAMRTGSTAAPPGAYSRCTTASASSTGTPISSSTPATELLPMPMEPVRPRMNMAVVEPAGRRGGEREDEEATERARAREAEAGGVRRRGRGTVVALAR